MGLSGGGLGKGAGLGKGGLGRGGLVSVSRVSPSRANEADTAHEREHKQNGWTARRHGFRVVASLSFLESALVTDRGEEIIAKCEVEEAAGIVVPTLRRLGAGMAQVALREMLEAAGFLILSGKDSEDALLRGEPGHLRDAELMQIAARDYFDWALNTSRRSKNRSTIPDYWLSPEGLATMAFIEERPHLKTRKLAAILEAHGYLTAQGKTTWYPAQISRVREYAEALRNDAHPALQLVGEAAR